MWLGFGDRAAKAPVTHFWAMLQTKGHAEALESEGVWLLQASQVVLVIKNLLANTEELRGMDSIPGLGSSSAEGHGNPLQYSCLENPHGQRNLTGYNPWGVKESDMTEATHTCTHGPFKEWTRGQGCWARGAMWRVGQLKTREAAGWGCFIGPWISPAKIGCGWRIHRGDLI